MNLCSSLSLVWQECGKPSTAQQDDNRPQRTGLSRPAGRCRCPSNAFENDHDRCLDRGFRNGGRSAADDSEPTPDGNASTLPLDRRFADQRKGADFAPAGYHLRRGGPRHQTSWKPSQCRNRTRTLNRGPEPLRTEPGQFQFRSATPGSMREDEGLRELARVFATTLSGECQLCLASGMVFILSAMPSSSPCQCTS